MKTTKQEFKEKVLVWLKKEKVDISNKKYRIYNYRGNWELRIYQKPQEFPNRRKSFRETSRDKNGRYGSYGIHNTTISLYTHISEEDLNNKDERTFILGTIKNQYE